MRPLLSLFVLALAVSTAPAHAAETQGDYVALQAPDVAQATAFFRDVLNCRALDGEASAQHALIECGSGTVVELSRGPLPARAAMVTLTGDDPVRASAWLRANHVTLIDASTQATPSARSGVRFLAPWGQPLQLVGQPADSADEAPRSRLAVQ